MTTPSHEESSAWGRRLARAWVILAVLTVLSVGAALGTGTAEHSGLLAVVVALTASFIKARQVLDHFLDLRQAEGGWRSFFTAMLLVILLGCFAIYAVALTR